MYITPQNSCWRFHLKILFKKFSQQRAGYHLVLYVAGFNFILLSRWCWWLATIGLVSMQRNILMLARSYSMITVTGPTRLRPGLGDQKDQRRTKHLSLTIEHTKLLDSWRVVPYIIWCKSVLQLIHDLVLDHYTRASSVDKHILYSFINKLSDIKFEKRKRITLWILGWNVTILICWRKIW
jgi:hypothetical protein